MVINKKVLDVAFWVLAFVVAAIVEIYSNLTFLKGVAIVLMVNNIIDIATICSAGVDYMEERRREIYNQSPAIYAAAYVISSTLKFALCLSYLLLS